MNPIEEGETVLWTGGPQRRHRRFRDLLLWLPVVVLVPGLGLLVAFYPDHELWISWYFSIAPAVSFAANAGSARSKRFAATSYIVTDRRLILVVHWPHGNDFRWVPIRLLGSPRVHELGDGVGTVDFDRSVTRWMRRREPWRFPSLAPIDPELIAIPDARKVAELIDRNAAHASVAG
ncbi:hypothetical protein AB0383_46110 [Amycolatopsis sp. NPDC051373]|uniref:hypothetical protein n=1 Tax=Amycolatopsis sp. NPDC051373 TaxID=3155801 RepID=UPI003450B823